MSARASRPSDRTAGLPLSTADHAAQTAFLAAGTTFAAAAITFAAINAVDPFTRGWWLVSYLFLVGCVSQILLGRGQLVYAVTAQGQLPSVASMRWQLALWNLATVAVAAADMASDPVVVLLGGLVMLAALGCFAAAFSRVVHTADRRSAGWERFYLGLLISLAWCVVIGCALAHALPGQ